MVAQRLYESGFITYMRTDSTRLSDDAKKLAKEYITSNYGKEYTGGKVTLEPFESFVIEI